MLHRHKDKKIMQFGHSKDGRKLRQVNLSMLVTKKDGIPVWHHTYNGNINDVTEFKEFIKSLNEKDQKTVILLSEKKILRDKELDPLTRVSLRQTKDFSIPLEVGLNEQRELFWKWYLLSNEDAEKYDSMDSSKYSHTTVMWFCKSSCRSYTLERTDKNTFLYVGSRTGGLQIAQGHIYVEIQIPTFAEGFITNISLPMSEWEIWDNSTGKLVKTQ